MRLFFAIDFDRLDPQKVDKVALVGEAGEVHTFQTAQAFADFLRQLPRGAVALCQNGGRASFYFLLPFFDGLLMIQGGRICRGYIGECEVRDSWLLAPVDLRSGLDAVERAKETARIYAIFADNIGVKMTLAGACLAFFMREEGLKKRDIFNNNGQYDAFFRRFFFGGRCEVFRSGEISDLEFYDINSAYSHAMCSSHAWGLVYAEISEKEITGTSFVECKGISCGAFPFRENGEMGKLSYPRDKKTRVYHVTGWEFLKARELGLFDGVVVRAWQHAKTRDFRRYVGHFYDLKKSADRESTEYLAFKLALNSLYGKFAQFPDKYRYYYLANPQRFKISDKIIEKGIEYQISDIMPNGDILSVGELPKEKREYINVATAASISGFVRAKMLEVLAKSKGIVYCDTDSLACEVFAGGTLSESTLGAWKRLGHIKRGAFLGRKLYCLEMEDGTIKTASKGAYLGVSDFDLIKRNGKALSRGVRPVFNIRNGAQSVVINKEIKATCQDVWIEDFYEMYE